MPPKSHKEVLEEIIKALDEGKRNIALSWIEELYKRVQFLENIISTSPTLLTPSDSDVKTVLGMLDVYTDRKQDVIVDLYNLNLIRTAILRLMSENTRQ